MGSPRPRTRAISLVRSGRIGRHRTETCRRESGERRRNLELSHHRGSDSIYDGPPRADTRAAPSRRHRETSPACGGETDSEAGREKRRPARRSQGVEEDRVELANFEEKVTLPHLRFSRDKRGYENTFIVQSGGSRRRGKPRSRILYWFHTPPGVRVGRTPLDEEAIRLIEEHNPDVEFDWTRILKGEGSERRSIGVDEAPPVAAGRVDDTDLPDAGPGAAERGPEDPARTEAETKLGIEGFARLRARYSELLARISELVQDPGRRDELKLRAERLNPDTWVTDAEVAAGLETYETELEALRSAVGVRRRKRRRSKRRRPDAPPAPAEPAADESDAEDTTPDPEAS